MYNKRWKIITDSQIYMSLSFKTILQKQYSKVKCLAWFNYTVAKELHDPNINFSTETINF